MNIAEDLKGRLESIIHIHDLYGRSFTYGVALRIGVREQLLSEDMENAAMGMIEEIYYEPIKAMQDAGLRTDNYALTEIIDLAVLDEIARSLIGEL